MATVLPLSRTRCARLPPTLYCPSSCTSRSYSCSTNPRTPLGSIRHFKVRSIAHASRVDVQPCAVATVLANVYLELLICLDFSLERYKYDVPEFTSSIVRYAFAGSALMWLLALVDLANVVDATTSAEVLIPFGAGIFLFPFYVALTTSRMVRVGILKPDVDPHKNAYELDLEEVP
ncbi:hypothetical protein EXIGLDRAFT_106085 [Exidia glandulosa HHB12029]|uniref:Uncharacterized protein n=1 Tax=Exidia glandulosa HHB12029 TaxID=1314781 RepID=A0A166AE72_EXIGL|nr:hypothetical protein EXIGLDRAFT_106085 [Exidia glandulosa HHB12029]